MFFHCRQRDIIEAVDINTVSTLRRKKQQAQRYEDQVLRSCHTCGALHGVRAKRQGTIMVTMQRRATGYFA